VAEATEAPRFPTLRDSREVIEHIRRTADTVHDPCGMAVGVRLGLNEMGLLRQMQAQPSADGWNIRVQLRLTSPGCQYFFLFKENLEERLSAHPQISHVVVDWDPMIDWTPEDLTPAARSRLDKRRRSLWQPDGG
jgi:metal-sulfur cluster biosynthetic enzyme